MWPTSVQPLALGHPWREEAGLRPENASGQSRCLHVPGRVPRLLMVELNWTLCRGSRHWSRPRASYWAWSWGSSESIGEYAILRSFLPSCPYFRTSAAGDTYRYGKWDFLDSFIGGSNLCRAQLPRIYRKISSLVSLFSLAYLSERDRFGDWFGERRDG